MTYRRNLLDMLAKSRDRAARVPPHMDAGDRTERCSLLPQRMEGHLLAQKARGGWLSRSMRADLSLPWRLLCSLTSLMSF